MVVQAGIDWNLGQYGTQGSVAQFKAPKQKIPTILARTEQNSKPWFSALDCEPKWFGIQNISTSNPLYSFSNIYNFKVHPKGHNIIFMVHQIISYKYLKSKLRENLIKFQIKFQLESNFTLCI